MKNAFLHESETRKALIDFLSKDQQLSMSGQCAEFEKRFSVHQKRKFSNLFNSGGSANLALLQALLNLGRLKKGDKVGFSALTWSTNVMPIIQLGLVPVPVDVELDTMNVSRSIFKAANEEHNVQAFFITNALGFVDDISQIAKYCEDNSIILIEDNCESLGTESEGIKTGNFGLASTFSFFVAHHMSTIEGGMICTDDEELSNMLTIVRANGWDRNLPEDKQKEIREANGIDSEFAAKYTFYDLGYNLRPTEITGFLGCTQLEYLDETIAARQNNYLRIEKSIMSNSDLIPLRHDHITRLSTFAIPVIAKTPELKKMYLKKFMDAGIETRPLIAGNIANQPFFKKYSNTEYNLPNTEVLHATGFYSGNYPELTEDDLATIEGCLKKS